MKKLIALIVSVMMLMTITSSALAIKSIPLKSIKLSKTSLALDTGKIYALKVIFTPANTTQKAVTFSTSNSKILTIDVNGKITAKSAGKATVTVKSNINKKLTAKCDVTVTKALNPNEPGWKTDHSPVKITWYTQNTDRVNTWGNDVVSKNIKEKTGVDIEFLPIGDPAQKLSMMVASGLLPDVVESGLQTPQIRDMVKAGMLLDLNKLADKYDPYFKKVGSPAAKKWFAEEDGSLYGYPNFIVPPDAMGNAIANDVFVVRKDIYEAIGKPDMTTPEGFLNALKAAKEKFPKALDGTPLIPFGTYEWSASNGCASVKSTLFNFLHLPMVEDGKWVYFENFFNPDFVAWIRTLRKANETGLLSKEIFTDKQAQINSKAINGKYFAMSYSVAQLMTQVLPTLQDAHPESVYIAIDAMQNSKKEQAYFPLVGMGGWLSPVISKNTKHPDRIIKFFTYLLSTEGQLDLQLGKEGDTWERIGGIPTLKPVYSQMLKNDPVKFNKEIGGAYSYGFMFNVEIRDTTWQAGLPKDSTYQLFKWVQQRTHVEPSWAWPVVESGSEQQKAKTEFEADWVKYQVKLIAAESDAAFDTLYNELKTSYNNTVKAKYNDWAATQVAKNIKKLGLNK